MHAEVSRAPGGGLAKESKRALRRHHLARRKRWVRKNLRHYFGDDPPEPGRVGLYANTPAVCSCWMCGNPRRYFGELSIQEQRVSSGQRRYADQFAPF